MTLVALPVMGVLFIAVAAFMAALESALSFFPRHDAELIAVHGRSGSLEKVLSEPQAHLNSLRFWRVWSEMAAAVAIAIFLVGLLGNEWLAGFIGTVVMALLGFMLVGVSPRRLGRLHSGALVGRMAWLVHILCRVLGPVPQLLIRIGSVVAKDAPEGHETFVSEGEFREFVDRTSESDMIEDNEAELINSVFDLGETMVRAVMVPRTDIVSVDQGQTLDEALEVFLSSGYSRIPVTGGSTDHILGILYLKDVVATLHRLSDGEEQPRAAQLARNVRYVPDSKPVDDLLNELQRESTHVAIVVDEYGGTAGLVTLEDLIEEIVGEIADEYDLVAPDVQELGNGRFRIRARMAVDELGELFGKDLDDDEVDTVGGFMAKHLGKIPSLGNSVEINGVILVAERMEVSRNRVSHVIASTAESADNGSRELRTLDSVTIKNPKTKQDGSTQVAANPTEQHHRSDHE